MEETTASWPDQGSQQPCGHPDIDALPVSDSLGYGAAAFFGTRANIDYHKKMVLRDKGWW